MADARATSRKIRGPSSGTVNTARIVQHSPGMFAAKVALRLAVLPSPADRPPRVLDCYAGDHDLWNAVREITPADVTHIDQHPTHRTDLSGNNLRYLASLDLSKYDLIDLDAWGQPDHQVAVLAERGYRGVVVWTCICSNMGVPSGALLAATGIDPTWLKITRKVFESSSLQRRWFAFLAKSGWTKAVLIDGRRNHLYGAVGYTTWDDAAYRAHYEAVRRTGSYAQRA